MEYIIRKESTRVNRKMIEENLNSHHQYCLMMISHLVAILFRKSQTKKECQTIKASNQWGMWTGLNSILRTGIIIEIHTPLQPSIEYQLKNNWTFMMIQWKMMITAWIQTLEAMKIKD
jgi:hypothetical protein